MKAPTRTVFSLRRRRLLGAIVAPLIVSASAAAQSSGGKTVKTRPASTPRFRIDIPEKDWTLLPAGVCTHGCLAHKDDAAAIVIEHELLQIALTSDEIDRNYADLELAAIKERETSGTGFMARVGQVGRRRAVIVDYQRPGAAGAEQVRVFVLLQGLHLYRLVCVAPSREFTRYEPVFQIVSSSFTPSDATSTGPAR